MNTHSKRWQALGFLVAGAFLSPLDYFIVNMALPAIQKAFNATDQQLQLVVAIYGLTYAALVVCGGRLGDIYGRKKIFTLGLYIFLFSSIACAFSPDISVLIAARLFQGVGASLWLHRCWHLFGYYLAVLNSQRQSVFLVLYLVSLP
nr:MFS transporter [Elizabethkingia bruuniana]